MVQSFPWELLDPFQVLLLQGLLKVQEEFVELQEKLVEVQEKLGGALDREGKLLRIVFEEGGRKRG